MFHLITTEANAQLWVGCEKDAKVITKKFGVFEKLI
jgi:hypothetical protein